MKSFSQFIYEAVQTQASKQAQELGLVGMKGAWYTKDGVYAGKTVNGKLQLVSGRGAKEKPLPKQGEATKAADLKDKKKKKPPVVAQTPTPKVQAKPEEKSPKENQKTSAQQPDQAETQTTSEASGIVIVFGRFNPPTVGHQKLLDAAAAEAKRKRFDLRVYPSRTQDKKKNPLDPGTKIKYMKMIFSEYEDQIVDDPEAKTIFTALVAAYELSYRDIVIMVGQDRLSEFQSLAHKYNGDLYNFDNIEVVSAGSRDADSEGVEGMSASKMRKAAMNNDFSSFAKGIPNIGNMEKKNLFNTLRKSMGAKEVSEVNTWEYAPELDPDGLRNAYLEGELFKIGALVENVNTGETGRITRRGTNYVICMTSEGHMFKTWLKDLVEAYEIGTDDYRKYVQAQSAGQPIKKFGPKVKILPTITPLKPNDPIKYK